MGDQADEGQAIVAHRAVEDGEAGVRVGEALIPDENLAGEGNAGRRRSGQPPAPYLGSSALKDFIPTQLDAAGRFVNRETDAL
jgi:hypothetical protein